MDAFSDLRFFALRLKEGSLAAAAQQMGITPPAASRVTPIRTPSIAHVCLDGLRFSRGAEGAEDRPVGLGYEPPQDER